MIYYTLTTSGGDLNMHWLNKLVIDESLVIIKFNWVSSPDSSLRQPFFGILNVGYAYRFITPDSYYDNGFKDFYLTDVDIAPILLDMMVKLQGHDCFTPDGIGLRYDKNMGRIFVILVNFTKSKHIIGIVLYHDALGYDYYFNCRKKGVAKITRWLP